MNTRTLILAVDPGKSGALAFLDYKTDTIVEVCDMPLTLKDKTDKQSKRQMDLYMLAEIIDRHAQNIRYAIIEDVHSMPHDGVVSAFSFGRTHGVVIGVIASYLIPIYFISPSVWKRAMGLGYEKDLSREKASELYKASARLFEKKKDDGRAEACLLANFGRRFWL